MSDPIDRQAAIDAIENTDCELSSDDWDELTDAIMSLPSEQKTEELLPDGTLHLFTDVDLSKVGRVLVSQNGTPYSGLYYADGEPKDRPKAHDVYYEETDHCEFKCSLCHATIGVVEGGTLDGANFKYCPWCGAELEDR